MSTSPIIEIHNANIFQKDHLILSSVDLTLNTGDFRYLIGKTGSGKTSLLKTLYGDLPLAQGEGTVCGFDLKKMREKDIPYLRRKMGIVFQDFQLLTDRNISDNLLFVLKATGWKEKKKMNAKINEVLEKVGMATKGFKMPYQLSGGEQQRVAIARALLNDPELILADEPTGNLDPGTSEEIMLLLEEISKNARAILMATHDYSIILKFPHETLKCDEGRVFSTVQKSL